MTSVAVPLASTSSPRRERARVRSWSPRWASSASATGGSEPLKPIAVKTIKVKLATMHTASLAPAAVMIPIADEAGPTLPATKAAAAAPPAVQPPMPPAPPSRGLQPSLRQEAAQAQWPSIASAEQVALPAAKTEPVAAPARGPQAHSGWIIQIGAFGTEDEAKQHLDAAQTKARSMLGRADAFTEAVTKGDKTFYRARFAGLDKSQAEATCKQLKHSDIACMTVKN